jgi:hypothetical protein
MNRSVKLSHLVLALAAIAALLLVSPALGGPSLKSLVKQEVSKQLAQTAKKKGKRGPAGPPGPAGAPGAPGAPGADGSAVAYAHINADGTLDAAHSKNISGVAHNTPAHYYCIKASVPVHNAVASIGGIGGGEVTTFTGDPFTSCQPLASSDFQFITSNSAGTDADEEFWVVFN